MRLKQIHLSEVARSSSSDVYSFIHEKWDGNDEEGLVIEPFDVLVKYHGEAGGNSAHPYQNGTASENHGDSIQVLSLTANEAVKTSSPDGPHLDTLASIPNLHALVLGKLGTGTLTKVIALFPDAVVLKGGSVGKGTAGALQLFNFFDDHEDDDVIIDVDNSPMLNDIHSVVIIKALLDEGIASYRVAGEQKEIVFNGRIVIVASDQHEVNDSIEHRCAVVDLTKDRVYPRGTPLQEIPGWDESSMKFFEEKAHANFTGMND